MTDEISFDDFQKADIRVGRIIDVQSFEKARMPTWKLWIDFGEQIGVKKSSAQITVRYDQIALLGGQVAAVVNFSPRQIADFISEVLVLGFSDVNGDIVLVGPERPVGNGGKLH